MLHFARGDCESAMTAEREGVDTEPVHGVGFLRSVQTTGLRLQSWSKFEAAVSVTWNSL